MADIPMNKLKAIISLNIALRVLKNLDVYDRANGGKGSGTTKGVVCIGVEGQQDLAATVTFTGSGIEVTKGWAEKPKVVLSFPSIDAFNDFQDGKGKPNIKGLLFGLPLLLKFKHMSHFMKASLREDKAPGGVKTRAALMLRVLMNSIEELTKFHPVVKGAIEPLNGVAMYGIAADDTYYHVIYEGGKATAYDGKHPNPTGTITWPDAESLVAVLTQQKMVKLGMTGDFGFCMNAAGVLKKSGEIMRAARESK